MTEEEANKAPSHGKDAAPPTTLREDRPHAVRTALVDHPWIKTFLAIAGFVVAVVGLAIAVWVNLVRPAPGPGMLAGPSEAPPAPSQQSGMSVSAVAAGNCFTADWTKTGCDVRHHWEVVQAGPPCSTEQALSYLGGVPGVDVLALDVVPIGHSVDGREACFLGLPPGDALTTSIRDALQDRAGDVWRRCIDDRVAREVPCSVAHTAEVVGPPAAGELNCSAQGDRYAETSLSKFSLDLSVSSRGPEGHEQCVVAVRGENILTHSIRRLGSGAPPIAPD